MVPLHLLSPDGEERANDHDHHQGQHNQENQKFPIKAFPTLGFLGAFVIQWR